MELIKKWIAGSRNFYIGVVLYNQFCNDARLKKYFEGSPDAIKQKKLEEELTALLQKPNSILHTPLVNTELDTMPESTDAVLTALRNEWHPLYQRMNYLRHELDKYQGNHPDVIATRKPIAVEILSLEKQCMKIWTRRDHYLDTGGLPEVKPNMEPIPDDPVQLGVSIETLKKNIRRNRKLFNENPDNTKYALKVKEYQAQLDRILKSIKDGE
ncbi:MAG: hypothetical protein ABI675_19510 [Chitinophagaceae bacterium]